MQILEQLKEVLRESIPQDCDDITATSHLVDDLGFDSLDRVEVTMGIEEKFEIEIGFGDADKWNTVGDIIAYLDKVLPTKAKSASGAGAKA